MMQIARTLCKPVAKAGMSSSRALSTKLQLPDLPWDFGELEPVISSEIMELHYSKHHNAYVTNGNLMMEQLEEAVHKGDTAKVIGLQNAIKFNCGGHLNHSIFWKNLCAPSKGGGQLENGELRTKIEAQFGDVDKLQGLMSAATVGVQGSGWGWLG